MRLTDRVGALAQFGRTLGEANVSLEGGGVFCVSGMGLAHFLVQDGTAARAALEAAGSDVTWVRDVVMLRLRQDVPGQMGELASRMATAGVNIETQYSDHHNRLVLVVDQHEIACRVAAAWDAEWFPENATQHPDGDDAR